MKDTSKKSVSDSSPWEYSDGEYAISRIQTATGVNEQKSGRQVYWKVSRCSASGNELVMYMRTALMPARIALAEYRRRHEVPPMTKAEKYRRELAEEYGELDENGCLTRMDYEGEPLYTAHFDREYRKGRGERIEETFDGDTDNPEPFFTEFEIDATDCEYFPELQPYLGKYFRLFCIAGEVTHTLNDNRWCDEAP